VSRDLLVNWCQSVPTACEGGLVRSALLLVLITAAPAHAEVKLHAEASLWLGPVWGEQTDSGQTSSVDGAIVGGRAALGAMWISQSRVTLRGGAVVDAFFREPNGVAYGFELQSDMDLAPWPGWRIGGRFAAMLGEGDRSPAAGNGQMLVPGVRLRREHLFVGLDAILVRTHDGVSHGHANGFLLTSGVSGKAGGAVIGGTAVVLGVVGLLALAALSGTH
jgi:hypothetical protein